MIKVIWVMVGGAVGSVLRIIIRDWSAAIPGDFPWGTFGVNILGAFLLGFFVTITVEVTRIRSHYRAGIAEGCIVIGYINHGTRYRSLCPWMVDPAISIRKERLKCFLKIVRF
jgi:hypothetical protein